MSRKPQDATDELLRALRASVEQEDAADEGDSPDNVFSDHANGGNKHGSTRDEEIAAFDQYMASLLGEVLPDEEKPTKSRSIPHKPSSIEETAVNSSITEALEKREEAELSQEAWTADLPPWEEEAPLTEETVLTDTFAASESAQEIPYAAQEEEYLPSLAKAEQPASDSEQSIEAEEPLMDARETAATASDGADEQMKAETDLDGEQLMLPIESLAPLSPFMDEAQDSGDMLLEGDIVLDADDDMSQPPNLASMLGESATVCETLEKAELPTTSGQGEAEDTTVVPVSSPLDAARMAEVRVLSQEDTARPKQSPLDAMSAGHGNTRGNVAPLSGAPAVLLGGSRDRSLSDEDVEVLLDLGYENNLTPKVTLQRVETIKKRRREDAAERHNLRGIYGCCGREYAGHAQDKEIKATYRRQARGATVRLVFTLMIALFILLVDVLPLTGNRGAQLPFSLSAPWLDVGWYGIGGMMLLMVVALMALPMLCDGMQALFSLRIRPASISALLLIVTLLYDLMGLFTEDVPVQLNLPTAIAFVLMAVGECIKLREAQLTFAVVSAHSRKIATEQNGPKKKKVMRDGHIVKIINEDGDRPFWRVRRTERIGGYFARMGAKSERFRPLGGLVAGALMGALILFAVTLVVRGDWMDGMMAFLLSLQLMLPMAALIAYGYPRLIAASELMPKGCAIVGDTAVEEYSEDSLLIFDDVEMFRSKSSTEITVKGGGDAKKYIRYAKRLFRTLGGTLQGVTTSDLTQETYEERVDIIRVMDEGVEARIDGKMHILAGTSAFMVKNGIRVPGANAEVQVRRHVESCILYLAFEGKIRLGYEIDYRISGRFEQMVANLAATGVSVAVESVDPNIHDALLTRSRRPGLAPIRVFKPFRFRKLADADVIDSGVVATRSARDIARAVIHCRRIADNDKKMSRVFRIMLATGVLLSAVLLLGDAPFGALVTAATLFPLLWCLPCMLITRKNMLNEQDRQSENNN